MEKKVTDDELVQDTQEVQEDKDLEAQEEIDAEKMVDNESKELCMTNDEIMNLVASLEETKAENASLKDEFLRAKADMENSKKRLMKHYDEMSKNSTKQLLLDVVNMLDDFERAMAAGADLENKQDNSSVLEGINLIESQFIQTLENKWRLVRFNSKDEPFDPDRHEAMMSEERDDIEAPIVTDEFSKGYMLDDKILRPAKVKVATPK